MSARLGRVLLLTLALGLPSSCAGYEVLDPAVGRGRSIAVPPTLNDSSWIGLEAPLTRALRTDLQRQLDVRLDSDAPDLVLETTLVDPLRRGRVGLRAGAYALGSVSVQVDWTLTDRSGAALASGRETRELEFITSLEPSERSAYDQIFQSVSEKIVLDVAAALRAADRNGS
ncbi:MAG: LPS assembly lipoprotein LptE [Planctomycetota bacterium]|nr:LPS assembly lipoprotein LptE [Planctomycetota bacterium]